MFRISELSTGGCKRFDISSNDIVIDLWQQSGMIRVDEVTRCKPSRGGTRETEYSRF